MTGYYRLSGGGNDFLALVEPPVEPTPERVRAWCARGLSAGADGVFALARTPEGARMTYWNADGGEAALCLNGTRCAARLAVELGWAADDFEIATGAGPVAARAAGKDRIELALPAPTEPPEAFELTVGETAWAGWRLEVGVPHFVLDWPGSLARAPVAELGPALRAHPGLGGAGANVHFARFPAPRRLELRSFERGVEAETLACGTGVLAAAAVGVATGRLELPAEALTRGGFRFEVGGRIAARGQIAGWSLAGDARLVARGELLPGAERLPPPPDWSE